ncbi:MAG: YnbE family lipoprotein [Pseudomonadota bacterium]
MQNRTYPMALAGAFAVLALPACTVAVKAPEEPITINLNVKIDQEVRVKLDREVDDLIAQNPDLFGGDEGS